jgi:hypothetical protein
MKVYVSVTGGGRCRELEHGASPDNVILARNI